MATRLTKALAPRRGGRTVHKTRQWSWTRRDRRNLRTRRRQGARHPCWQCARARLPVARSTRVKSGQV